MTYLTMEYLKEAIPKKVYEDILKKFNGCLIYVSKKEHENREDKKLFLDLMSKGATASHATKIIAQTNEKSVRSVYYKREKGLFDEE